MLNDVVYIDIFRTFAVSNDNGGTVPPGSDAPEDE